MHRWLVFLVLMCFVGTACAEIPCQCDLENCQYFIQMGDGGPAIEFIQHALIVKGYLAFEDDSSTFDEATRQAVIQFQQDNHLPLTGMMDDETLTLILWNMLPEELDKQNPLSSTLPVWIPNDGGIRHHVENTCSQMFDPHLVTQRNALAMNMLHCGRCQPPGYIKIAK